MLFTNAWHLSLLFVVSGYASAGLLARHAGVGPFVRERIVRLGLPLIFAVFVVVTPQPWAALVSQRVTLIKAVFPFYIIHQTIILVVGYWLLPTSTSAGLRFAVLVVATAGGCLLFYVVGRRIAWLRPWIGLRTAGRGIREAARETLYGKSQV